MRYFFVVVPAVVLTLGIVSGEDFLMRNKETKNESAKKETESDGKKNADEGAPRAALAEAPKEEDRASAMTGERVRASGKDRFVSPSGSDDNPGESPEKPLKTIQKAVDAAQAGDVIHLADGTYLQDIVSRRDGEADRPITLTGSRNAVVKGGGNGRVIEINHDHITLDGFTVDGLYGSKDELSSYRDKLLYVLGKQAQEGVTGLRVLRMRLSNAGGECVRLRYFARKNEIAENEIANCGVHDFRFRAGGKNGEGVYIGTAPEQLKDGKNPTRDPDRSDENWIHHNRIDTQGNECVDIKEGASGNIVEYNECTGQKDAESAGLDSRGNGNVFRYNTVSGSFGAGVRLGGDGKKDGVDNEVYGNRLFDNRSGGIKFQASSQRKICGNTLERNDKGGAVGTYGSKFKPDQKCPQ
jgi:hypothetical protein